MSSFNITDIPNPLTPLAFFPPEVAYQTQIGNYVFAGTLGALIWDILCNAHNDYKLLFKYRLGVGTVAYFVARITTLLYILGATIFATYPLVHCMGLSRMTNISCALTLPANCSLFFLRARAIFNRNRVLIILFSFLWVTVAGTAILVALPGVLTPGNVGPTSYCTNLAAKPWTGIFTLPPLVHDTVIFLAISWRMFRSSYIDRGFNGNLRAFATGEGLPAFSRSILQDGQMYYLITVIANLPAAVMTFNTALSPSFRTMFFPCTVMVTNCMASHVFRNTKFGIHRRIVTTTELTSRSSGPMPMFRLPVKQSATQTVHISKVTTDDAARGGSAVELEKVAQI
ncbi:hypothetical protein B0H19DRAFT_113276 [Mycena capillaripes]|nr:hypothetical protein B0H19DRAFT_113276 [Mycena capillaripes]